MNVIKIARLKKGLLQKELAFAVGISTVTLQKYESAERFPRKEHLLKLREVLGISLDDVLNDYAEQKTESQTVNSAGTRKPTMMKYELDNLIESANASLQQEKLLISEEAFIKKANPAYNPQTLRILYAKLVELVNAGKMNASEVTYYAAFGWCAKKPDAVIGYQIGPKEYLINELRRAASGLIKIGLISKKNGKL